jgi:hypothetical protein
MPESEEEGMPARHIDPKGAFMRIRRHTLAAAAAIALNTPTLPQAQIFTWNTGDYVVVGLPNPLATHQVVNAVNGGVKSFSGDILNQGRINWQTGNDLRLSDSGTILRNQGLLDLQADQRIRAFGSEVTLDNAGVLRKSAGSGTSALETLIINRAGATLDVASGTLLYTAGGSFEAGSVLSASNGGRHLFQGIATYHFHDSFSGPGSGVQFSRGDYVSAGGQRLDMQTDLLWTGGRFLGAWMNGSGRTLSVADGGWTKDINGSFLNQGTLRWQTGNDLHLSGSGTTLRNEGLLDLQADQRIRAFGSEVTLDNAGVLRKSAGSGTSRFETALINTGAIEALAGTIELPGNWTNHGELRGNAALRSSALANAGSIAPGLADADPAARIATLSLQGQLLQTEQAWLLFELGADGLTDLLAVSGSVSFSGGLRFSLLQAQPLRVGDSFRVMTFASYSGQLDQIVTQGFGHGVSFEAIYGADFLDLRVSAVPEPSAFWLLGAGLLALGWRLRRR